MLNFLAVFAISTLSLAAPLILAALGGLMSERAGIMNIGLEGKMLMAACVCCLVADATHNALIGIAAGLGASLLLSLLHLLLAQVFRVDQIVSGMGINAFSLGATNFLDKKFVQIMQPEMPGLPKFAVWVGESIVFVSLYLVLAYVLPFAISRWMQGTRAGLRLQATGHDPEKARLAGIDTRKIRLESLLITGVLAGLAGILIVDNVGHFTDNMTGGRGYIALAAVIIGGWRPIPTLVACLAFGAFYALQIALQGVSIFGVQMPPQFWQSLPYIAAVVVLAGVVGRSRPPYGLGKL